MDPLTNKEIYSFTPYSFLTEQPSTTITQHALDSFDNLIDLAPIPRVVANALNEAGIEPLYKPNTVLGMVFYDYSSDETYSCSSSTTYSGADSDGVLLSGDEVSGFPRLKSPPRSRRRPRVVLDDSEDFSDNGAPEATTGNIKRTVSRTAVHTQSAPVLDLTQDQIETLMGYLMQANITTGPSTGDIEAASVDARLPVSVVRRWMNDNKMSQWYRLFLSECSKQKTRKIRSKGKVRVRDEPVAPVGAERGVNVVDSVPRVSKSVWELSPASWTLPGYSRPVSGTCVNGYCRKYDVLNSGLCTHCFDAKRRKVH